MNDTVADTPSQTCSSTIRLEKTEGSSLIKVLETTPEGSPHISSSRVSEARNSGRTGKIPKVPGLVVNHFPRLETTIQFRFGDLDLDGF